MSAAAETLLTNKVYRREGATLKFFTTFVTDETITTPLLPGFSCEVRGLYLGAWNQARLRTASGSDRIIKSALRANGAFICLFPCWSGRYRSRF